MKSTNLVSEELKGSFNDSIITLYIKRKKIYVYVLIEHKSYNDKYALFQLMLNTMRIWESEISSRESDVDFSLTPIIPIFFHHGSGGWKYSNDFSIYFDEIDKELKAYIPNFRSILYDLTDIPDAKIKGNVAFETGMLLMKYIKDLKSHLEDIFRSANMSASIEVGLISIFNSIFLYIFTVEEIDKENIKTVLLNPVLK